LAPRPVGTSTQLQKRSRGDASSDCAGADLAFAQRVTVDIAAAAGHLKEALGIFFDLGDWLGEARGFEHPSRCLGQRM
jgi:hypothetical protein